MKWPRSRPGPGRSRRRGGDPSVGVVVPAYGVQEWLPACLDSLRAQTHTRWRAVVVDDGSPDRSGEIAEQYAARDARISVLHTENAGLGAARNAGTARVGGDYLAYLDSDDVLPPTALADLVACLESSGSDLATGSVLRCEPDPPLGKGPHEPPWMRRLHREPLTGIDVRRHPEILGDVFAWNKLYRRSFWDEQRLSWPEGVRYEDQPTTTRAYLAGTFDVLPQVVYHWRIRADGTSITQQRSSVQDLLDRWATKRMSLDAVRSHGDPEVLRVFRDQVLPGDLWRYFLEIPGCDRTWWTLLSGGVKEHWGEHTLLESGLPPVHRVCGWLVGARLRAEATALMEYVASLDGGPVPRTPDGRRLDIPASVLLPGVLPPGALDLRPHER